MGWRNAMTKAELTRVFNEAYWCDQANYSWAVMRVQAEDTAFPLV